MKKVLLTLGVLALASCSSDDDDIKRSVEDFSCNCVKNTYALVLRIDEFGNRTEGYEIVRTEDNQCGYDNEKGEGFVVGSYYVLSCRQ